VGLLSLLVVMVVDVNALCLLIHERGGGGGHEFPLSLDLQEGVVVVSMKTLHLVF